MRHSYSTRNLQQNMGFDEQCCTFSSSKSSYDVPASPSLFSSKKYQPRSSRSSCLLQNPGLKLLALFFGFCALLNTANAADKATNAAQFLEIGAGTRACGMGEAFTSVANDASAVYWNPAGLTGIENGEAVLSQYKWLEDMKYTNICAAESLNNHGVAGLGIYRLSKNNIQGYSSDGTPTTALRMEDLAVAISYAFAFKTSGITTSFGVSPKYVQEIIADVKAKAFGFDAGFISCIPLTKNIPLRIGCAIKNVGTKMRFDKEQDPLPRVVTTGISTDVLAKTVTISADYTVPRDNDNYFNFGTELRPLKEIALRFGYRYKPDSKNEDLDKGVRCGISFGYFEYAYVHYGNFNDVHQFSVTMHFKKIMDDNEEEWD